MKDEIIQDQTVSQYPISKGVAIIASTVLAIITALIFPLGEFILYGFVYLAGKEVKERSKK